MRLKPRACGAVGPHRSSLNLDLSVKRRSCWVLSLTSRFLYPVKCSLTMQHLTKLLQRGRYPAVFRCSTGVLPSSIHPSCYFCAFRCPRKHSRLGRKERHRLYMHNHAYPKASHFLTFIPPSFTISARLSLLVGSSVPHCLLLGYVLLHSWRWFLRVVRCALDFWYVSFIPATYIPELAI
jgi:hypothetical protein